MKFFSSFASSMGLLLSFLLSASIGVVKHKFFSAIDNVETIMMRSVGLFLKLGEMYLRKINFKKDSETDQKVITGSNKMTIEELVSFPIRVSEKLKIETSVSFKNLDKRNIDLTTFKEKDDNSIFQLKSLNGIMPSQSVDSELDAAAIKLQKVYKSYRTRRNLADSAVVAEELWWKALEFAALKQSSVLFFDTDKRETAVSRWTRARIRVAKVGKGLSKDVNARKLALQHWLEAIDPRHRYGHNLHYYYNVWFDSESNQPFFYWLDVGDGKEVNLERCPRNTLQHQCIKYLGPKEREAYEVVVDNGKLVYKQSGRLVDTSEGSKWIFVLSTSRSLYVGQKKKGLFQHSSFLAGGATTAAGRLVSRNGILQAIWPYSGHYLPTEENFREFINFLEEHHVDLTNVKTCSLDADSSPFRIRDERDLGDIVASKGDDRIGEYMINVPAEEAASTVFDKKNEAIEFDKANVQEEEEEPAKATAFEWRKHIALQMENRSTGAEPRIGSVKVYPTELRFQALKHVNLSPRSACGPFGNWGPIPSPRNCSKVRSPTVSYIGLPSPRVPQPKSSSQFTDGSGSVLELNQ